MLTSSKKGPQRLFASGYFLEPVGDEPRGRAVLLRLPFVQGREIVEEPERPGPVGGVGGPVHDMVAVVALLVDLSRRAVHAEGPGRVRLIPGRHVAHQPVRNPNRAVQVAPVARRLVEHDELRPEARRLVRLQETGARPHVTVIPARWHLQVVGIGKPAPRLVLRGDSMGQPIVGHQPHVVMERRIAQVPVEQVPRRKRHVDLVPPEPPGVVLVRLPNLVQQVVGHPVRAGPHGDPKMPDLSDHMIVGLGRPGPEPGHDFSLRVRPHLVIAEAVGRSGARGQRTCRQYKANSRTKPSARAGKPLVNRHVTGRFAQVILDPG